MALCNKCSDLITVKGLQSSKYPWVHCHHKSKKKAKCWCKGKKGLIWWTAGNEFSAQIEADYCPKCGKKLV